MGTVGGWNRASGSHRAALLALLASSAALASCDSDLTGARTETATLTFRYASGIPTGSASELAGACAHHALGSTWIHFVAGRDQSLQLFNVDHEVYQGEMTVVLAGATTYRLTIRDLECCSYADDEPCWPTEGLSVNGTPVTRVVALPNEVSPERVGLELVVDSRGRVLP